MSPARYHSLRLFSTPQGYKLCTSNWDGTSQSSIASEPIFGVEQTTTMYLVSHTRVGMTNLNAKNSYAITCA